MNWALEKEIAVRNRINTQKWVSFAEWHTCYHRNPHSKSHICWHVYKWIVITLMHWVVTSTVLNDLQYNLHLTQDFFHTLRTRHSNESRNFIDKITNTWYGLVIMTHKFPWIRKCSDFEEDSKCFHLDRSKHHRWYNHTIGTITSSCENWRS